MPKHTLILFLGILSCTLIANAQDIDLGEIPDLAAIIPTCGDCFCVPGEGEECPGPNPEKSFNLVGDQLEFLNQDAENPYSLECSPYTGPECQTTPPQEFLELGTTAVCGLQYLVPASSRLCSRRYMVQSYPSREEAEADGAIVTHVGSCGVCSTTKDLAAFMSVKDITPAISKCLIKVTLFGINLSNLIECVQELGITFQCANLLSLNAINLSQNCALRCQNSLIMGEPNQGLAPACELSDCLQCANEFTLPIFESFAGRDPHRSGILGGYAYPCTENVNITHEVCPKFEEKGLVPTFTLSPLPAASEAPSSVPKSGSSLVDVNRFVFSLMGLSFIVGWIVL